MSPSGGGTDRATAAVAAAGRKVGRDPVRPASHFRPPAGWMNDPNGTLWHRGRHHLFYQHNPYGDARGDVHWGHARSRDLVQWEHLPVALAPSRELGEAHCFTGSAWKRPDGTPMLFYSSFPEDTDRRAAEQWAVLCDDELRTFEKWEGNPLLSLDGHGGPQLEPAWRDPFVFADGGRVFMILGGVLSREGTPAILLYEARGEDLLSWGYRGVLHRGDPGHHRFFECPNLVSLGDRHLLVWSDHGPVRWLLGDFDPDAGAFRADEDGIMDRSPNFYATGRVADAPGEEPVLVGWVRGWAPGRGWNGCLGLPRCVRPGPGGVPLQRPVPAATELRAAEGTRRRGLVLRDETVEVEGAEGTALEVRARLSARGAARGEVACGLRLLPAGGDGAAGHGEPAAEVRLRPASAVAEVGGRSHPLDLREGVPPVAPDSRARWEATTVPLPAGAADGGGVELRVVWDRSVLELFLGDGREACTRVMAVPGGPVRLEAFAEGGAAAFEEIVAWPLEEIW